MTQKKDNLSNKNMENPVKNINQIVLDVRLVRAEDGLLRLDYLVRTYFNTGAKREHRDEWREVPVFNADKIQALDNTVSGS